MNIIGCLAWVEVRLRKAVREYQILNSLQTLDLK